MPIYLRASLQRRAVRTPLFETLRRGLQLACFANRPGELRPIELVETHRRVLRSRRELLRASATSALALGCGALYGRELKPLGEARRSDPKVAIVGAGIAGLMAAYELKRAGLRSSVYEASKRTGGRIYSSRDLLAPGLTSELGGEFIDSDHAVMLGLAKEFDLELIDLESSRDEGRLTEAYFFEGTHHTEAEVVEAFLPLAKRIEADSDEIDDNVSFENEGGAGALDRTSIAEYLDRIGAAGWIRRLIEVAYVAEFGLDCDRLSVLNLLFLISTDLTSGKLALYGESDERYKVRGGNQQVTDALAERIAGQIHFEHKLEAIRSLGDGYRLSFTVCGGGAVDIDADFVIIAIPFSVLRHVALRVELPEVKKKAIAELGYGTNTKLLAGVVRPVWKERGYTGVVYSDEPFQSAWDNSQFQGTSVAGLTLFSGGQAGVEAGAGTAREQIQRLIGGVDRAFPGVLHALNGKCARFHWPSHPYAEGSYACYKPGQWTTIAGAEGRPVANLLFAGEHCSFDSSGFMNSGAASGQSAAREVLSRCER